MQEVNLQKARQKTGIVIFDTKFGNTEKIARSITSGLDSAGVAAKCLNAGDVKLDTLSSYDLIVVGGPTQAFTASMPMKDFVKRLRDVESLKGKYFYAFDTKLPSRFSGSASKYIESQLERCGLRAMAPRSSAIGRGSVFRLDEGEEKRFEQIGTDLGNRLIRIA